MKEKFNAILKKINFQKNWKIFVAALVGVAVLITVIALLAGGKAPEAEAKDYTLVVVTDSSIDNNNKVSNYVLTLVIGADNKIVAARFDCADITPALDEAGALIAQTSVATKVEQGASYAMTSGSWAEQAKAFEDAIVGKTADEVASLDLTLVAGCTMPYSPYTFKALVAKAFASTLKVNFSTADTITVGTAINSAVKSGKGGKVSVASDFAGVVMANGKVVATMIDSCEQSFTIEDGALVAPETAAVSKNDQGESYVMPAGTWYKQAQAFADSTVGKTVDELANIDVVSDALAAAGCTMQNTTGGYKTTIIAAAGYAR